MALERVKAAQPSRNRNRAVAELPAAPGESSKPICAAERPSEQPSLARRSRVEAASARPQPTRQPAESRRFDPTQAQPKRQSVAVAERSRGSRTTNSRRAARNPEAEASRARPSRVSPVASRAASPPVASRAAREIPVPSRAASAQAEPVLSSSSRAARTKLAPSTYILRGISSVGARALQPPSRDFVAWKAYCLAVRTRQVDLQIYFGYDECRDGECRNDLCDMLYADAMCMYTAIRVPVSLILLESYLHGCPSGSPPIEDCVVSPGTEDQSYVPTGAHDCTCSGTCQRLGRGRGKGKGKLASDPKLFRLDLGITVSFIYGVMYLVGTVSYGITTCCASFEITRLMCVSDRITRLICVSDGITRLICMSFGITRLTGACVLRDHETVLCRIKVMDEVDRRRARMIHEGHMGMFSLMLLLNVFIVPFEDFCLEFWIECRILALNNDISLD
ncbi:hypothetical protein E6C27_scaffold278G001210 [Cucumis melo var. makuwa]|uniref:Uncharacterized protein n=1 Tax=Cucumis melo var. makuwa TaxID=1194695 RepID=A0A5A7T7Q9_CUCMM|nr:hypothetical protein E6C27_scaffold278G001210 [Cucumis melo var. makuwa]